MVPDTLFGVSSVQELQAKLSGVLAKDLFALFEAEGDKLTFLLQYTNTMKRTHLN